jgi:hypothetical protein
MGPYKLVDEPVEPTLVNQVKSIHVVGEQQSCLSSDATHQRFGFGDRYLADHQAAGGLIDDLLEHPDSHLMIQRLSLETTGVSFSDSAFLTHRHSIKATRVSTSDSYQTMN